MSQFRLQLILFIIFFVIFFFWQAMTLIQFQKTWLHCIMLLFFSIVIYLCDKFITIIIFIAKSIEININNNNCWRWYLKTTTWIISKQLDRNKHEFVPCFIKSCSNYINSIKISYPNILSKYFKVWYFDGLASLPVIWNTKLGIPRYICSEKSRKRCQPLKAV